MQSRVDKYLEKAFEAIRIVDVERNTFYKQRNPDVLYKEYKGYISSFGANIVQAGVRAAITFYEAEESGSDKDRRVVNAAIKYILTNRESSSTQYDDYKLSSLLESNDEEYNQQMALDIMDAATALKLALRTYKMK